MAGAPVVAHDVHGAAGFDNGLDLAHQPVPVLGSGGAPAVRDACTESRGCQEHHPLSAPIGQLADEFGPDRIGFRVSMYEDRGHGAHPLSGRSYSAMKYAESLS